MIRIENEVYLNTKQMEFIISGMRNPMNSWDKMDSHDTAGLFFLGDKDKQLMKKLAEAGTDHRKFMRMIPVYVDITAPLYWWKEFDTYKVGTVANSCSTMHKIAEKEFAKDDFSIEHLNRRTVETLEFTIDDLNRYRELYLHGGSDYISDNDDKEYEPKSKDIWWQMIQLLPSSYNQKRSVMLNYEVLANMYKSRKNHKLDEWRDFCKWIEDLPFSYLITGEGE